MNFTFHHASHRVVAIIVAISLVSQSCCFPNPTPTPKVLDTQYRYKLGKIAIIATEQEPEIKIEGLAHSRSEGAAKGAGKPISIWFEGVNLLGEGPVDPVTSMLALVILGVCIAVSPFAAIIGALATPSAKEMMETESALSTAIQAKKIQELFRDQVVAFALAEKANLVAISPEKRQRAMRANDYSSLAVEGADTVVEISLTKVRTVGDGITFDTPVQLQMEAHVRIIRMIDNTEIFSSDYYAPNGKKLKLSEWFDNQNEQLFLGLKTGFETLGVLIYQSVLVPSPPLWEESRP